MLVLSRKSGESIKLGPNASVRIVKISGNQVKLGIEAPRTMRVLRGEFVCKTEVTVMEDVVDTDPAKQAEELAYCLKLILGCMQYPTSLDRVDIIGVPTDWTKRAMAAIAAHDAEIDLPTLKGVWAKIASQQEAE